MSIQKWEYLVTETDNIYEQELNEQGNHGWELISAHLKEKNKYKCVFKRPVKSKEEVWKEIKEKKREEEDNKLIDEVFGDILNKEKR